MPTANHHRLKKLRHKLSLAVGSTLFTLFVLEIVFRIAGIQGDYRQPRIDKAFPIEGRRSWREPFGFFTNSIIVSKYDSDPRGYFEPNNTIAHKHNSVGWRDTEHTIHKPNETFRILGLGDSYLWGQGVKRTDICLTKLPNYLNFSMSAKTIETVNAGISGFNTVNERDQLIARGLAYNPDLVIVHFVLNDVEDDIYRKGKKIEFFREYTNIYQSSDWFSKFSNVWSWSRFRVRKHVHARRYVQECVNSFDPDSIGWRSCRSALSEIQAICDKNEVLFCVVVFPFFCELDGDYPFQEIHTIVTEYCQSLGIPVLDLRDSFKSFKGPELWVHPTDQHPNEIAHDIAARAIAQFLQGRAPELLIGLSDECVPD